MSLLFFMVIKKQDFQVRSMQNLMEGRVDCFIVKRIGFKSYSLLETICFFQQSPQLPSNSPHIRMKIRWHAHSSSQSSLASLSKASTRDCKTLDYPCFYLSYSTAEETDQTS